MSPIIVSHRKNDLKTTPAILEKVLFINIIECVIPTCLFCIRRVTWRLKQSLMRKRSSNLSTTVSKNCVSRGRKLIRSTHQKQIFWSDLDPLCHSRKFQPANHISVWRTGPKKWRCLPAARGDHTPSLANSRPPEEGQAGTKPFVFVETWHSLYFIHDYGLCTRICSMDTAGHGVSHFLLCSQHALENEELTQHLGAAKDAQRQLTAEVRHSKTFQHKCDFL